MPPGPVDHGPGLCPRGEGVALPLLAIGQVPGPVERGAWLFVAFLALVETVAGGAAAGGLRPPARCRASPAAGMFWGRGLWPRPQNAAAPRMAAPILPAPPGNRSSAGGEALAKGRVGTLGCAGGRRRFAAWAAKRKKGSRRQSLRLPILGRCAPPPPPRPLEVSPSFQMERLFLRPKTYPQN